MPFDWANYLKLAAQLSQGVIGTNVEAAQRTAMSRAYYAAFGHACNYAQQHGFTPNGGPEDHLRLRDHYRDRGMTDIATKLEQLRLWRNDCDYKDVLDLNTVSSMLPYALKKAGAVLEQLK